MNLIINRKAFIFVGVILLSLLSFLVIKSVIIETEITNSVNNSTTLFTTAEEIISQINDENDNDKTTKKNSSNKNKSSNKKSIKSEIENAKSKLSKEDYKSANSNYDKMVEHVEKLEKYKKNPFEFDNQGFLKNAPSEQIRQKIIQTRISHLEKEIQSFYNNIIKIIK